MGSRVFDYLTERFLFDDSLIREDFSGIGDDVPTKDNIQNAHR